MLGCSSHLQVSRFIILQVYGYYHEVDAPDEGVLLGVDHSNTSEPKSCTDNFSGHRRRGQAPPIRYARF